MDDRDLDRIMDLDHTMIERRLVHVRSRADAELVSLASDQDARAAVDVEAAFAEADVIGARARERMRADVQESAEDWVWASDP
ncbi:MAG: hypothetical protein ACHREM_13565 [Polyangiales bacterium]